MCVFYLHQNTINNFQTKWVTGIGLFVQKKFNILALRFPLNLYPYFKSLFYGFQDLVHAKCPKPSEFWKLDNQKSNGAMIMKIHTLIVFWPRNKNSHSHSFFTKEFRNSIKLAINEGMPLKKKIKVKSFAKKMRKHWSAKILMTRVNGKLTLLFEIYLV